MHLIDGTGARAALFAVALVLLGAPTAFAASTERSRQLTPDGAGLQSSPGERPPSPQNLPQRQENLELVGRFQVPGVRPGQIADVAVHKGFAYLNSWDDPNCQGGGTYVVDIRDPSQPRQVAFIPAPPNFYHGEGAHAVSIDTPQFQGDILAVNDETYGSNVTAPCAASLDQSGGGFDLYDVTDPANPVPLVQGAGDTDPDNDPATPPRAFANSYHSVFVWQDGPRAFLVATDNIEFTDVDIFDITDPTAPEIVADIDLLELFPQIANRERANGGVVLHHDVVVKNIDGRQVMMSDYWDAGYVQLDVSDPRNPRYIVDTFYEGEDPLLPGTGLTPEGNAHQGEFSFDNQFLLAADEDFATHRFVARATDGPTVGRTVRPTEGDAPVRIIDLPDGMLNGPSRFVGEACTAASVPAAPADDGDPATDDIALIERGGTLPDGSACSFADKLDNAAAAGWDGAIVFNQVRPDDGRVAMLTGESTIPAVHLRRVDAFGPDGVLSTGAVTPAPDTAGPRISVGPEFDGWGYGHLYDARTGARLDSFAIPEALDERFAFDFGDLSIHEFATDPTENLAYSSYYAGGIRVLRFSRAAGLEQVGAWIAPGGSNFWGVEQFTTSDGTRLIAGSDRDFGLVILRYTGPGAPQPPSCADASVQTGPGQPVRLPLVCTDPNGNPLRLRIAGGPANGTLGPVEGGSAQYTPSAGFVGSDSVRFVANDGAADSRPATVAVTVTAAAAAGGPGVTPPAGAPSNRVVVRLGKYRKGRVLVRLVVPGPGTVKVVMRADLRRVRAGGSAAAVTRLARVTRQAARAGTMLVELKPSKAKRRRLARTLRAARRHRVEATITTSFTPIGGTTGKSRRTLVIRR